MASRDYYHTLGVSKKATADEIKSAYRKLARQLHPDVNKAADAQKKFTDVQNAYDILSDEKKRATYDQFGAAAFESGASQEAAARAAANHGPHYSWNNVGQRGGGGGATSADFDTDDLGSIFETMFGGGMGGGMGSSSGGRGRKKSGPRARHIDEDDSTIARDLDVDFMVAAKGGTQTFRVVAGAKGIDVKIPPGTDMGTQLRVRAAGPQGQDVVLTVRPSAHKYFRRGETADLGKGLDLYVDVPISIAEATLGGAVSVPTLDGKADLAVPPGTPSGRKLRLRGQGIHDAAGRKGDLYAVLKIMPLSGATLSEIEAMALRDMSARSGPYRTW